MSENLEKKAGKLVLIIRITPIFVTLLGLVLIFFWMFYGTKDQLKERVPGEDKVTADGSGLTTSPVEKGNLTKFNVVPIELPGSWERFRGANFDGISTENIKLARRWGPGQPKILWGIDVGEGYAGAAILKGRVYLLDYDAKNQSDVLRCLTLSDGKDIWRYSYPVKVKRNHGMSRTVPAVTDKYVVSLGPKCHVLCLNPITGDFIWGMDLVRDFNTIVPEWYAGQCPLIENDNAIIAPGGDALMIAVDCATGNIIWKTPNPHNWNMTHSSIMPMDFNGKRIYVYCASGGVVGVSAKDGSILWETDEWKIGIATVPSPVIIGDGRIFLTGGYGTGSMMIKLVESRGKITVKTLYRLKPDIFSCDQQTPILYKGHIYGVRPDGQLACIDLEGKLLWTSGSANRFGLGPFMIADGLILVMDDYGLLTLAEATSDGYKQLAQARVLNGHDAWGPMALAGGRLIVRDLTKMVCLDVSGQSLAMNNQ
ncbi:TPA: polyvinylalcohol dehydrogenase [Candidatus Poribacteria bacterium]|nr:polyvinylalcohol dehydrogenase [Candidatus Poribacteria bacterium]